MLHRLALVAVAATMVVSGGDDANAQAVRLRRGVRLAARALYGPPVRLGPAAAVPGVGLTGPYVLVPRGAFAAPPAWPAARYAAARPWGVPPILPPSDAPRYTRGATLAVAAEDVAEQVDPVTASETYLSATQLAALDDGALLNEVLRVAARLDAEVGRFRTGAGWQSYLRLADGALPPPGADGRVELGLTSISATLDRLHSVAAEPAYSMISSLPSFSAMQAALGEVVSRVSVPRGAPTTSEVEPTTAAAQPVVNAARRAVSGAERAPGSAEPGRRNRDPVGEVLPTPPPILAAPENSAPE